MAEIIASLSFSGFDALGVPTNFNIDFEADDTKTLAQVATWANDTFDHFTPTSDAGWGGIGIHLYPVVNNPTDPQTTSIAERTGLFNFSQAAGRFKYGSDIESIASDLIVNGKIDLTATEVTNWVDYVVAAHSGFILISKAANALVGLLDAIISFRKKRKLESRRSFETS